MGYGISRRITKAKGVVDTQAILLQMHMRRMTVGRIMITSAGYVMVEFNNSATIRYAGMLSEDVVEWIGENNAVVYEWNVSGGETFQHETTTPRLFGLNLCIAIKSDADSQAETPDRQAPQGQPR